MTLCGLDKSKDLHETSYNMCSPRLVLREIRTLMSFNPSDVEVEDNWRVGLNNHGQITMAHFVAHLWPHSIAATTKVNSFF